MVKHIRGGTRYLRKKRKTLYNKQFGKCALCKRYLADTYVLDHNHTTGAIRGLLCRPCNSGLGMIGETPEALDRAANYLRRYGY